jgi:two-component system phosphate regulon sensor histidine kinase PhoR
LSSYRNPELLNLMLLLVAGAILGSFVDAIGWGLFVATLIYIVYMLRQLFALERWLLGDKKSALPEAGGIWGNIHERIYRLQKRNRKQKRLLASALTRFQKAATALPDAFVILQEDDQIEWCNGAAKRLLGLSSSRDSHQRIANLLFQSEFIHYFNQGDFSEPLTMASPINEAIILSIRVVPYGESGKLLLARDMTQIMHLEQTRKRFVANVSHELRTPLTVFNGYVESMVMADDEALSAWRKPIVSMQQQSLRMTSLVDELLMLSRLETKTAPKLEQVVAVPEMLVGMVQDAEMLSGEKNHQIKSEIDDSLMLKGAENELRSAFQNLVSNAVRYTPADGSISLSWQRLGDKAVFVVKDSGIGIDPKHLPHLTERFYRVDTARSRDTGGTGLGLSIVKHVLSRHGAELNIYSRPGQGSEFCCIFPPGLLIQAN